MGLLVSVQFEPFSKGAGETEFKLFPKSFEPFSKGSAGETESKLFSKSFGPFLKGLGPFSKGSRFVLVPFPKGFSGAALFQRHARA